MGEVESRFAASAPGGKGAELAVSDTTPCHASCSGCIGRGGCKRRSKSVAPGGDRSAVRKRSALTLIRSNVGFPAAGTGLGVYGYGTLDRIPPTCPRRRTHKRPACRLWTLLWIEEVDLTHHRRFPQIIEDSSSSMGIVAKVVA